MKEIKRVDDKEPVVFDIEGTLTEGTAWEGVRDYLVENGEEATFKTFQRRMIPRYLLYRLNLGDTQTFRNDWISGILALLAGKELAELQALGRRIVSDYLWPNRREDIVYELTQHQEAGRPIIIVSGQFQPFLDAFVEKVGADAGIGTPGSWQGSRFSGQLAAPFTIGERKANLLEQLLDGRPPFAAYGDTAPDVPMLAMSDHPTAVYPDSKLLRTAQKRGWRVVK
ncbi:MAG: HAD family hydrolase [Candidatus Promineifilaceae bacterium]